MIKLINSICSTFGFQLIGTGTLKKLQKGDFRKDAFITQKKITSKNANVIFDVGANRGEVTKVYRDLFPKSKILAFEPFQENATIFTDKFTHDPLIRLHTIALSEKKGSLTFYVNKSSDTNSLLKPIEIGASSDVQCHNKSTIEVEVNSLDEFCKENSISIIDILKLDVQGSELNILKGASELIKNKAIKLIYTETYFKQQYKDQPLFHEIAFFLYNNGFYLEDIYNPYYNNDQILWCDAIFVNNSYKQNPTK